MKKIGFEASKPTCRNEIRGNLQKKKENSKVEVQDEVPIKKKKKLKGRRKQITYKKRNS